MPIGTSTGEYYEDSTEMLLARLAPPKISEVQEKVAPGPKVVKDVATAVAPNITSLIMGEPAKLEAPSNPDISPVGKIPQVGGDPRIEGAMGELAQGVETFFPVGGPVKGPAMAVMAGMGAATAKRGNRLMAEIMETAGRTKEEIFDKTGFFKGHEGKWKFEISDDTLQVRDKLPGVPTMVDTGTGFPHPVWTGKLPDVIKHDDLFAAYPHLKDLNITIGKIKGEKWEGSYSSDTNSLWINTVPPTGKLDEKFARVVLHEVQHSIQKLEDFSRGSNPEVALDEVQKKLWGIYKSLPSEHPDKKEITKVISSLKSGNFRGTEEDMSAMLYLAQSGEVEARNVMKRWLKHKIVIEADPKSEIGMKVRKQYPWESEDVPKEFIADYVKRKK